MVMKKNILVLFSGGADSTLLMCMAKIHADRIGALIYKYGQRHGDEVDIAERFLAAHPALDCLVYRVGLELKYVTSPLLSGKECGPREGVNENHVPARNLIFIAHAASIAESQGYDEIWYGADFSDRVNLFPDCTQEWVIRMNQVLAINGSRPLELRAPLLGLTKQQVIEELENCGIKMEEVFSGYGD
jgi:7-cyano-7-deazaguanine synthase